MAIKKFKPNTPGQRQKIGIDYSNLDKKRPEKKLTKGISSNAGRDSNGRISVRRRGGGEKRLYRIIDFLRNDKLDIKAKVESIEYDPNRTANIALLHYQDGEKRYIVAPKGLKKGDHIVSSDTAEPSLGNNLPLSNMPLGSIIHNIELQLGKGAQIARSAGSSAILMSKDGDYVSIKLPSGEVRLIFAKCRATIGSVSNEDNMNISLGKAGASRWRGRRPKVRGVAMNPVDHPHGGGNGHTSGGRHPVSPTGVPTKGYRTRNKRNKSSKFIVTRRKNRRI